MASSPDAVRRKLTKILRQKARARRPKWWEWVPGIFGERVFASGAERGCAERGTLYVNGVAIPVRDVTWTTWATEHK